MKKISDILTVIKNYQKIVDLTGGSKEESLDEFIKLLQPYKGLTLDSFQEKVLNQQKSSKKDKVSPRENAIQMGELYYTFKKGKGLSVENQTLLSTYLALPENQILNEILKVPFEQTYQVIHECPDKSLLVNHLGFLGMALLQIKLKSGSKSVQKKNLLDILWKVIENQKMNEIYENNLL